MSTKLSRKIPEHKVSLLLSFFLAIVMGILTPITSAQAGSISFVVAPPNFAFGAVSLNGSNQNLTFNQAWNINDTTVTDNGWNLQLTASALTNGAGVTLPAPQITAYTPTQTCNVAQTAQANLAAQQVWGQLGSYGYNGYDMVRATANNLAGPQSVARDASNDLYVADTSNNRVLYYPAGSTVPTRVYGQAGLYTDNFANAGGTTPSATTLYDPTALAVDSSGNLYVVDNGNYRVLYYPAGSTTATRVYGQGGSFTTNISNNGGETANSLALPNGIALDSSGNLYVSDTNNYRVLYYAAGSTTATKVWGTGGSFTGGGGGLASSTSLNSPQGIAVDSTGALYVSDNNDSRVTYFPSGTFTATRVYGQGGSFTTTNNNNGGISANSLNAPTGVAVDASNNVYIADNSNHRVLYYAGVSTTATRVYGQGGSFTTNNQNNGGVTANSLSYPYNMALDSTGALYIADTNNNRVLYYASGSTTATRVYGEGGSYTVNNGNGYNPSANSLYSPNQIALDSSGGMYVADFDNSRVLYYPSGSTTATRVYGQGGSFTSTTTNLGGVSANSLSVPYGVVVDPSNNVYIADSNNNRILYYPAGSTTATRVYGQGGNFTTNTSDNGGISANSLANPQYLALDSAGGLYEADNDNRVLHYPAGSTTADRVYGEGGSFTTSNFYAGAVNANSMYNAEGVAVDASNNVYITDNTDNRILYFPAGSTTATRVYGQGGSFTSSTANNGGISANSLSGPTEVALDSAGNLYEVEFNNNRALFYPAGSTTATIVYGQPNFTNNNINKNRIPDNTTLHFPSGVTIDSKGNMYIADTYNNRVLYFPVCVPAVDPGTISYPLVLPTSATKILNSATWSGTGAGTFNNQTFTLTIPAKARAGAYSAVWTLALTSGP